MTCTFTPNALWHRCSQVSSGMVQPISSMTPTSRCWSGVRFSPGGFDLESACAVGGFDGFDDYAVLDLLDALVRKSLLVADRSSGGPGFRCWNDPPVRRGTTRRLAVAATEARTAHARHFAGREADIMSLWDSPRQPDAYNSFTAELANLRTAFRWAADQGDLDVAGHIVTYAAFLGFWVENYEPITWAEELIEPARAIDHPRLTALYVMASLCYMANRIDPAIRYTEAAQRVRGSPVFAPVIFKVSDGTENMPQLTRPLVTRSSHGSIFDATRLATNRPTRERANRICARITAAVDRFGFTYGSGMTRP